VVLLEKLIYIGINIHTRILLIFCDFPDLRKIVF